MKIVDDTCIEETSKESTAKHSKSVVENIINFLKESKKKKDGIGVSTSVGIGTSVGSTRVTRSMATRSMGGGTDTNLQP